MAQLGYTNRVLLSLVLLQIYTVGISSAVYSQVVKNLTVRDGYIDTSCCINGECDILCCIRRGNCFYLNKKQKRMIDSFAPNTALCYDINSNHHLPLWDTLPTGAVGLAEIFHFSKSFYLMDEFLEQMLLLSSFQEVATIN